jgi:hypothetical protein
MTIGPLLGASSVIGIIAFVIMAFIWFTLTLGVLCVMEVCTDGEHVGTLIH